MYLLNGIAYAGTSLPDMQAAAVKPLDDMMLLVTFASGERRLYDAAQFLQYPAFQPLKDERIFKAAQVDHGVVTWMDGAIDIAPGTMCANSYVYSEMVI